MERGIISIKRTMIGEMMACWAEEKGKTRYVIMTMD